MQRPASLVIVMIGIVGSTTPGNPGRVPPGGARPGPTSPPARWSSAPPSSGPTASTRASTSGWRSWAA